MHCKMIWISLCCLQGMWHSACLYALKESAFCAILPPVNTLLFGNMALWHISYHANTMLHNVL